jgi:hypothetical protein
LTILTVAFQEWAVAALEKSAKAFAISIQDFLASASNAGEAEWQRIYTESSTIKLDRCYESRGQ